MAAWGQPAWEAAAPQSAFQAAFAQERQAAFAQQAAGNGYASAGQKRSWEDSGGWQDKSTSSSAEWGNSSKQDASWAESSWKKPNNGHDSWGGGQPGGKGACFICHEQGHLANDCPKGNGGGFKKKSDYTRPQDDGLPDVEVEAQPHFLPAFLPPAVPPSLNEVADVTAQREQLHIRVTGEAASSALAPITQFSELDGILPDYVVGALSRAGIEAPMPIQAQSLPFVLRGYDFIGIAKTGSGKTMAFLLPAFAHIERQDPLKDYEPAPTCLILAPVRELAVQIAEEANKVLNSSKSVRHPRGCGAVAIYGGGFRIRFQQIDELKKGWCQIVVATPGRMVDLLASGDLQLHRATYFVLDEADRMLDDGFGDQLDSVSEQLRTERQTLFFSATWPVPVRKLAKRMCKAPPIRVNVGTVTEAEANAGPTARDDIVQEVVVFDGDWKAVEQQKNARLNSHVRELLQNPEHKILVFVNMKQMTWELAEKLVQEGYEADFMYGGRSQDARHECVRKLKSGETRLLVTTDVMARGLDVPGISHVVVFDCYGGIEEYVHRIGRTARGPYGRGHALTFFEYDAKFSEMPAELITVLTQANQVVPPLLQTIADEVVSGKRAVKYKKR